MHEVRAQVAGVPVAADLPYDTVAAVHAPDAVGKKIRLRGWVLRTRSSGGLLFFVVRDRTGSVQVTARKNALGEERFKEVEHVQIEGAIGLTGTVAEDPRAPGGREVRADSVEVVHAGDPFPVWSDQTEEFRLDKRHLVIRSQDLVATFRVRSDLLRILRRFMDDEEVQEMFPPVLSGNAAEGGAEAFQLDYFGRPGYLAQTAQLYLEALLFPNERVYAVTQSFRAEKSRTPRHLTEYQHLEAELAWTDLDGLMAFIERMVVRACHEIAEQRPRELAQLGRPPEELKAIAAPFPRITYRKAIETLSAQGFPVKFGSDLGTAEERALTLEAKQPTFVMRLPAARTAFYMRRTPGDPETVEAADLLGPEGYGEIVGASCRETSIEILIERLRERGADPKDYEWYLDLRRHGSIPHAGFGMGVERLMRWMLRREHIRETSPFPRTPSRHTP